MDIRLATYFRPTLPNPDQLQAADRFDRADGVLTITPTGGLPYLFEHSGSGKPVAAAVSGVAKFISGTAGGHSYCTVDAQSIVPSFQIGVTNVDGTFGAQVLLQYGDPTHWLVATRTAANDGRWRLVKNEGAGSVVVATTEKVMANGDAWRRTYVNGKIKVFLNLTEVWAGDPLPGMNRVGFGLTNGASAEFTAFDLLSIGLV